MRKLLLALAVAGLVSPAIAADVTVAVTSIVEHPALNAVRDGVKEALAAAGFKDGANGFHFVFETAQGKPEIAAQIAKKFVGDDVSVIVAISTPSAQGAVAATKDIPIIFSAVTDPLAAELVPSLKKPRGNVTGVSDMSPITEQFALIREISPKVKALGVIFNPGETNSVVLVKRLKEVAGGAGVAIVESPATKSGEVKQAALALVGKVDAIYVPTDNTVVSALEAAVAVAEENRIPLYMGDTDSVARGAIASVGFNYHDVGIDTGKIVARVLKGEKPGDIDVGFATGTNLVVNKAEAAKVGVTIPDAVLKRAVKVIE